MGFPKESNIVINGTQLSTSEAMTVRVAVGAFLMQMQSEGLGDDETGRAICAGYIRACADSLKLMAK
jgi:hypothetical protein